jgi:hypothetical protein
LPLARGHLDASGERQNDEERDEPYMKVHWFGSSRAGDIPAITGSALLLPSQVVRAVPCHLAGDPMLAID